MIYEDKLKNTIIAKIKKVVNIPVIDSVEDKVSRSVVSYPKMLFMEQIDKLTIRVVDYEIYDKMEVEKPPLLENVVGLYICNATSKSLIKSYDSEKGIIVLESGLGSMVEGMDELIIESDKPTEEKIEDYIYVTSLSNFSRKLNYSTVEVFRRFEIGVFCYDDKNENKCNYYMEVLRSEFDRDFNLLNSNETAYISNAMKFDVVENGKLNRVVYGSILLKTYK
jgi:hypothetical protein